MKSKEIYKGQRSREKRALFDRFKHRAIENLYKNRFFLLFNNQCFKCGAKGKTDSYIGYQEILCIDHHTPMALGGHLVPGNLVALCRSCNSKKQDKPPEEFYTQKELDTLQPILKNQGNIFEFKFNWEQWRKDQGSYLLNLGVEPKLVHELLTNQEHLFYIGNVSKRVEVSISVNIDNIVNDINER